ncbi:MAG: glycosyltransferase family A protein, partial [Chloroflexota bacterium]
MPYFLVSTLLFLLGLGIIYWVHSQYHMDVVVRSTDSAPPPHPLISICVPARNEERNIRRCIESLLAQTYPNFEIIVVDDRSTDSTLQILEGLRSDDLSRHLQRPTEVGATRESRLHIIHGSDLPP